MRLSINKPFYKIIFALIFIFGSYGAYRAVMSYYGITLYQHPADEQALLKILHDDWYWLVSEDSVDYSAEYTLDHRAATPEYPDGSLNIFVYRMHGKPVGFVTYYRETGCRAKIQFLAVAKEYRKKGYAYKLLHYALNDAARNGMCVTELVTRTTNYQAQRLYERSGFKKIWEDHGFVG